MMVVDSIPPRSILTVIVILSILLLRFAKASVDQVSEARLSRLAEDGNKKAKKALKFIDKSAITIVRLQIVIVFLELLASGMGMSIIHTLVAHYELGQHFVLLSLGGLLILAFIIQLFGIVIPKKLTAQNAEKTLFPLMWLVNLAYYIASPFEKILLFLASIILKPFGIDSNTEDEEEVTEEEIRFMVDMGSESGAIEPDEKEMIHNIFELNDTPVKDIMTHRTEAVFLWKEESVSQWENTIAETNHSVYPVCGDSVDDILGIVKTASFYKLLRKTDNDEDVDLSTLIKDPYLVPESIKADDLFRQMQISKKHFAIVLDEYGGLAGIITMSDLLEEIVGDLGNDAESVEEEDIIKIDENTWKILGSTDIDYVSETLDIELPIEEYNTFSGMIVGELGAIPDDGTTTELEAYGLQIKVTKISDHKIDETIVCKVNPIIETEE